MSKVEHQTATALPADELRTLDAHWRAANYLSVGQIYLMANPLLTEPLRPEHIKPRLLGHWGTSPGLNLVYTHLNRVIKARDLDALCVWGPGHGGPAVLANSWLEGTYSETYPDVGAGRGGHGPAVPAVLLPRRGAEPCGARDAGLDPRGRRARLLALARLRRRLRQPGPAGRLRHRRRRGGDRPAGRLLALQQVPRPGARRRGPADPAPQRLQDRQPDGPGPAPRGRTRRAAARLRPRPAPRHRRRPRRRPPRHGAGHGHRPGPHRRHPARRPGGRGHRAPPLADDRAAHAQGLDRTGRGRRTAGGGHLARPPGPPLRRHGPTRTTSRNWSGGCAPTGPRNCSTTTGAPRPDVLAAVPEGTRRLGATPYANGGLLAARTAPAPAGEVRRDRGRSRAPPRTNPPGVLGDLLRDVMDGHRRPARLPARRPRRDRLQPPPGRLRRQRQGMAGTDAARRRGPGPARPGDGDPVRTHLPGLAGGLPPHRTARPLLLLRGIRPHRRLDGQPARQVAARDPPPALAAHRSPRSTTCSPPTSGARTTTASPIRTPASSTTSSTRAPRSYGSTCRRTPTPCSPSPTMRCAAATTST